MYTRKILELLPDPSHDLRQTILLINIRFFSTEKKPKPIGTLVDSAIICNRIFNFRRIN